MNWKKVIGFGLLGWIIMFVIISVFIGFKIYDYYWMKIIAIIISGLVSYIMAGYVKPTKITLALAYGLSWVIIGLILDVLVTARFNALIFDSRSLWTGYLLYLLAPMLQVKKISAPKI